MILRVMFFLCVHIHHVWSETSHENGADGGGASASLGAHNLYETHHLYEAHNFRQMRVRESARESEKVREWTPDEAHNP